MFALIAFLQIFSSCQRSEPETYLIPANFKGRVQILFNQNGTTVKYKNEYGRDAIYTSKIGRPIKYESGRRIYEIPSDGILLTQFKENDGFINRRYFSINNAGIKVPLKVFELEHYKQDSTKWVVKNKKEKGIFGDGTSGSYGNQNIFFQDFIVSDLNGLNSFYTKEYQNSFDDKIEKTTGLALRLK